MSDWSASLQKGNQIADNSSQDNQHGTHGQNLKITINKSQIDALFEFPLKLNFPPDSQNMQK